MQGGDLLSEMLCKPRHLFLLFTFNRMAKLVKAGLRLIQVILNDRTAGTKKLPIKARLQRGVPQQRGGLCSQGGQLFLQRLQKQGCFQNALQW